MAILKALFVLSMVSMTAVFTQEVSSLKHQLNCSSDTVPSSQLLAHKGWPFRVLCSFVVEAENNIFYGWYYDSVVDGQQPLECIILDAAGAVVFNATTIYDDLLFDKETGLLILEVDETSSLNYSVLIINRDGGPCLSLELSLNVIDVVEPVTCEQFISASPFPDTTLSHMDFVGGSFSLQCRVDEDTYPKVEAAPGMTFHWLHNCTSLPHNANASEANELRAHRLEFANGGSYACFARYNGMTRFIRRVDVCLRYKRSANELLFTCEKRTIRKNIGESFTLNCTANYGRGYVAKGQYRIVLSRDMSSFMERRCDQKQPDNPAVACSFKEQQCYYGIPREQNLQPPNALVNVQVQFRNIDDMDYGLYILKAYDTLTGSPEVNVTFILESNPIPGLLSQASIAGICIGALLIFTLVAIFMTYNAIYIRVYWKRCFGGYVTDDKKYGAMLAYNFSSIEMDKFAGEQIQAAVPKIRKVLESMEYKVFDERKDKIFSESKF